MSVKRGKKSHAIRPLSRISTQVLYQWTALWYMPIDVLCVDPAGKRPSCRARRYLGAIDTG